MIKGLFFFFCLFSAVKSNFNLKNKSAEKRLRVKTGVNIGLNPNLAWKRDECVYYCRCLQHSRILEWPEKQCLAFISSLHFLLVLQHNLAFLSPPPSHHNLFLLLSLIISSFRWLLLSPSSWKTSASDKLLVWNCCSSLILLYIHYLNLG